MDSNMPHDLLALNPDHSEIVEAVIHEEGEMETFNVHGRKTRRAVPLTKAEHDMLEPMSPEERHEVATKKGWISSNGSKKRKAAAEHNAAYEEMSVKQRRQSKARWIHKHSFMKAMVPYRA